MVYLKEINVYNKVQSDVALHRKDYFAGLQAITISPSRVRTNIPIKGNVCLRLLHQTSILDADVGTLCGRETNPQTLREILRIHILNICL